jgi:hypothetical protein
MGGGTAVCRHLDPPRILHSRAELGFEFEMIEVGHCETARLPAFCIRGPVLEGQLAINRLWDNLELTDKRLTIQFGRYRASWNSLLIETRRQSA